MTPVTAAQATGAGLASEARQEQGWAWLWLRRRGMLSMVSVNQREAGPCKDYSSASSTEIRSP